MSQELFNDISSQDEIIVFSHNDLDALGSMINIEFKFPNVKKHYYHTNYSNISQIVDDIFKLIDLKIIEGNPIRHILVPDVSFATDKESFTRLYNIPGIKITHIDHHLYPEGFWDDYPDMTVIWDKTRSATKLCNEFFENTGKNQNLDKLTHIIDVYDLWQYKSPYFAVAQDFNNYFWEVGIQWLCDEIVQRNFMLPENFKEVVQDFNARKDATLKRYDEKNSIIRSGTMSICFVNEFFNQVMLREMDNGQQIVVGINDYGIIRVRLFQEIQLSPEQIGDIRLEITGEKDTGHLHAFTYRASDNGKGSPSTKYLLTEAQKIANVFAKYL